MLTIDDPGLLLTVQDLGRVGWAHLGVPHSGAADRHALIRANRMVRNPADAAGLEATLRGARLTASVDLVVAITGATTERRIALSAGEQLSLPDPVDGCRVYLAVAGGIAAPGQLGSRSYCQLSKLGPPPLRVGDRLPVGALRGAGTAPDKAPQRVAVLAPAVGPHLHRVDVSRLPATFSVSPDSNRIGVRLTGNPLRHLDTTQLPSTGLVRGAIQVPPAGDPVIMLADYPTTGGYPVIGVVPEAQMATVAQLRPGDTIGLAPPELSGADRRETSTGA